jgi:TatD DNase family protein
MLQLFDTHVHLQDRAFAIDRDAVLARARRSDVVEMVVVGESEASSQRAGELALTDDAIWAAVGVHPHNAKDADGALEVWLQRTVRHPRVVAIGEIGLDFHYDRSPRDVQRDVFLRQLTLAAACDLPVVIHSRSALQDTLDTLETWSKVRLQQGAKAPLGVMHCFGYDVAAAQRLVASGFMISVPGTVTFPRADSVRDVARWVPDQALVIETDAPVLAPQGHRGKRNEPAYLRETAECVAVLRDVSIERLAELTRENARRLFRLPRGSHTGAKTGSVSP